MDESATYRAFVEPYFPNHWAPHSNNHVLNSLLMRLSVGVFGLSQFSIRLPALGGACAYVGGCYLICRRIFDRPVVRTTIFACLTLNPYVADFFAAARGYSLALGCLTVGMALVARLNLQEDGTPPERTVRTWMAASALFGLSFCASFPFAFIVATTWAALLMWTVTTQGRPSRCCCPETARRFTSCHFGRWLWARFPRFQRRRLRWRRWAVACLSVCSARWRSMWWSGADAKEVDYVLAYYNHHYKTVEVTSRPPLTDCLEFYRLASGAETFPEFKDSDSLPDGKDVYALYESQARDWIASQRLKIVYRDRVNSDVVVAVRQGLEPVK